MRTEGSSCVWWREIKVCLRLNFECIGDCVHNIKGWWPNQLNLKPLGKVDPSVGQGITGKYADAFASLDLAAVKKDINALMTDSQDWWPADYGDGLNFERSTLSSIHDRSLWSFLYTDGVALCRHL